MKLIVSNLKMYLDGSEIKNYLSLLLPYENNNIIICPSAIHIPYFLGHKFSVGIQNITYKSNKNQTGEISALQASNLGVKYVIIGHHERKKCFFETNKEINLKIKEALKNNLKVILCIGEENANYDFLKKDLYECLYDINDEVIIAYEPSWVICTDKIPSNDEIESVSAFIKKECLSLLNRDVKVLYGGNINPENIKKLNNISNIDGYLIGLSSSKINDFIEIIKFVNNM